MSSRSATIVWLVLVAATATSWALSLRPDAGGAGALSAVAILVIAFFKVRLGVLHFMEMRRAPRTWRVVFEGWIAVVCAALVALYFVRF